MANEELLTSSPLLDFEHPTIRNLIATKDWGKLDTFDKIGAAYDFVQNQIEFGYNKQDDIPASEVLNNGFGQCNTKGTLLMALLRALGIPCRLHGFTIKKSLQRGVVPELAYAIAPQNILHSWVEIWFEDKWINLEGFILDQHSLRKFRKNLMVNQVFVHMALAPIAFNRLRPVGPEMIHIFNKRVSTKTLAYSTHLTSFTRHTAKISES